MSMTQKLLLSSYPNLKDIPGPVPSFPLGNLRDLSSQSIWKVSEDVSARYGPYALLWVLNQPVVFVHDPKAIDEILGAKSAAFFKDEPLAAMRPALRTDTAFTANGPEWQQLRRTSFLSESMMGEWLTSGFEPGLRFLRARIARDLPLRKGANLEAWLYRLVFDFNSQMWLGRTVSETAFGAYNKIMDAINVRLTTALPVLPPRFNHYKNIWYGALEEIVEQVRHEPDGHSMAHHLARHSHFTLADQVNHLSNAFPGGVWSVTAAIGDTLAHLCAQPRLLADLKAQLATATHSYETVVDPLEPSIRETFRHSAPVPTFMRRVKENPVTVGQVTLDGGVRVMIGVYPLHRSAAHWSEPETYRPERWTRQLLQENPYGSDYLFQFGRGPRACLGSDVALFQIRSILTALLGDPARRVSIDPVKDYSFYFGCRMPTGLRGSIA